MKDSLVMVLGRACYARVFRITPDVRQRGGLRIFVQRHNFEIAGYFMAPNSSRKY